ncbi:dTDP-4-dehydrorhamnose reductase [Maribacter sp. 2307ULW6-5]|uniref:dTDP-4-dehydrorhamnose reductase n=1 Tax=Maribacter sp. 2307ULW6-5 TaxID=3386275 RepID=UPI0039BD347C
MEKKKNLLVTGAGGQLGQVVRKTVAKGHDHLDIVFATSADLDITDEAAVNRFMEQGRFDHCINCAAYTQVDLAETEMAKAHNINETGARNLARACKKTGTVLVHISTDFVFNGKQGLPYTEGDRPAPLSVYGKSKYMGEQQVARNTERHFIVRTSWLYAATGHNFFKSMLKYGREREALGVVYDQVGTPTFANDLAEVLLQLVETESTAYGIYHFSNEGVASWYDFAQAIFDINGVEVALQPIRTAAYPLPATRPAYSVMDKGKIKRLLNLQIPHWRESLERASKMAREETD